MLFLQVSWVEGFEFARVTPKSGDFFQHYRMLPPKKLQKSYNDPVPPELLIRYTELQ